MLAGPVVGVLPGAGRRGDRAVVGLGAAVERGQDVGQGVADVELVDVAARRRADEGDQPVVLEPDLLPGVEVEVGRPRARPAGRSCPSASSRALWAAIRWR